MADAQKSPKDDPQGNKEEKQKEADAAVEARTASNIGRLILKYHSAVSSIIIGVAGLVAAQIWQSRQAAIARHQAESQQRVAEMQAENSWKIERAEILAKNLQTLAAQGPGNVEQRYGVLLSLARGNILDPELAVSYALELGKDNPEYMRSVLASTDGKDYFRLARAFIMTCAQKYGVSRNVDICGDDKMAARSEAIAQVILDEMAAASAQGKPGPLAMLKDEHLVQQNAQRLAWVFRPELSDLYDRRLWDELARFEAFSPGAKLVASLVLASARNGEMTTAQEADRLQKFHADHRKWLTGYLFGRTCDGDCKGKLVEYMLSEYAEAQGDYDAAMRALVEKPRAESGTAVTHLHSRILWCQVDADDMTPLRDNVLVPALHDLLAAHRADGNVIEDVVGLLALTPEPSDAKALAAWKEVLAQLGKVNGGRMAKVFDERRAQAKRERTAPPPAMKRISFCGAAEATGDTGAGIPGAP
jgi:hypothetical protein